MYITKRMLLLEITSTNINLRYDTIRMMFYDTIPFEYDTIPFENSRQYQRKSRGDYWGAVSQKVTQNTTPIISDNI